MTPSKPRTAAAVPGETATPEALPWTPQDAWDLLADLKAAAAALERHMQSFTDSKGAVLCGGCLRPAPCPDAELLSGR